MGTLGRLAQGTLKNYAHFYKQHHKIMHSPGAIINPHTQGSQSLFLSGAGLQNLQGLFLENPTLTPSCCCPTPYCHQEWPAGMDQGWTLLGNPLDLPPERETQELFLQHSHTLSTNF
jgi:hypothetical protein